MAVIITNTIPQWTRTQPPDPHATAQCLGRRIASGWRRSELGGQRRLLGIGGQQAGDLGGGRVVSRQASRSRRPSRWRRYRRLALRRAAWMRSTPRLTQHAGGLGGASRDARDVGRMRVLRHRPDGEGARPRPGRADGETGTGARAYAGTRNRRSIRPAHQAKQYTVISAEQMRLRDAPPELVQAIVTGAGPTLRALDLQTAT